MYPEPIQQLLDHCANKPGTQISTKSRGEFRSEASLLNGEPFAFIRFESDTPQLLLRCTTDLLMQLNAQYRIRTSKFIQWSRKGWVWIDVPLDGRMDNAQINDLIDLSHRLTLNESPERDRQVIALREMHLSPQDAFSKALELNSLQHRREEIERLLMPAVMLYTLAASEGDLRIGQTKLGGRPDMPDHFNWPVFSDTPLVFLAQINLSEIPQSVNRMLLPAAGILYFFSMYGWQEENGAQVSDGEKMTGFSRVLWYTGDVQKLRRQVTPSGTPEFRAAALEFRAVQSLPHAGVDAWDRDVVLRDLGWTDEELESLDTLSNDVSDILDYPVGHQLLGYARPVQNPMTPPGWRLLFSIESDWDNAGMMFDDGGVIFYTIEERALEWLDFSNVRAELQSH